MDLSASQDAESGNATDTKADANTSGDAETEGSDTEGAGEIDLFACGIEPSCPTIYDHIEPEPAEAIACATELIAFRRPGVIIYNDSVGPSPDETLTLSLVRNDGTAIIQKGTRPICVADDCPFEDLGPVQVCTIHLNGSLWSTSDCEALPDYDCADAQADLAADAPPTVECGDSSCAPGQLCVEQTQQCVCDEETHEYDFVPGPTGCASIPAECEGLGSDEQYGCLSTALCEPAALDETGFLSNGTLVCGSTDLDCFGEC